MSTEIEKFQVLRELIDALIEDTINEDEQQQLNALLRDNDEAIAFYVDYMALSADLHRISEESMPPEAVEIAFESELSKRYYNKRRFDGGAAAAAILLLGFLGLAFYGAFPGLKKYMPYIDHFAQQPLTVNYATVVDTEHALINGRVPELGLRLGDQEWLLEQGSLSIQFEAGTTAVIYAPSRFQLTGYNNLSLLTGKSVATVPQEAVGYTVETPDATVVDLGTRFGVSVSSGESTDVHVFKGKVHARLSDRISGAEQGKPKMNLTAGQAVRVQASARNIIQLERADESVFAAPPAAVVAIQPAIIPPQNQPEPPSPFHYFEDFSGSSDLLLTGSKPDSAPADARWLADGQTSLGGTFDARYHSYAALPFRPEAGHLYHLSIEVFPGANPNEQLDTFTLGFVAGSEVPTTEELTHKNWHNVNEPRAWMQLTHTSLSVSNGPDVENFTTRAQQPFSKRTLKMMLDTRGVAWKFTSYIGTGFVSEKVFETNPVDIDHISFGTSKFSGSVDNLKLLVE